MGGNRCSKIKQYWNVLVTFLVSGFWHGANWTFVVWGVLHGMYQIIEKTFGLNAYLKNDYLPVISTKKIIPPPLKNILRVCLVFCLITINWVLFQANSISDFFGTICALDNGFGETFIPNTAKVFIGIIILFIRDLNYECKTNIHFLNSNNYWIRIVSVSLLIIYIMTFGVLEDSSFIYFQF